MADTITKIASEYDMVEIMQNIGSEYFGSDLSQQRIGMFGYLTESMAHMFGAAILDSSARANEYNTATAQRLETLLYEASMYGVDVNNAVPETMSTYIGIQTSNIINPPHQGGFATQEKDINNENHPICTLVIEKDTVINIANYDFMFEYDIQIKANWSSTANKYMYSVKYLTEGDMDNTSTTQYTYPKANTLTSLSTTYIQSYVTTRDGESVLLFKVNLKQMSKFTDYYTIIKNDMISLTGVDFLYDNMLSHFNVYYKENNKKNWEYIKAVSIYDTKTYDERIVHYEVLHDESKIRLNFDDFTPTYNSEFRLDMYGTLGTAVNNIKYSGDGSDIIITLNTLDERHSYAGLYLICLPITSYGDGKNVPSIDEIRDRVIRMKSSLNSLDTEYDLYNFIREKDQLNDYVFMKKRSDARERRYASFTIPRMETEDIIPSSTMNICIPLVNNIYPENNSGIVYPIEGDTNYSKIITIKAGTPLLLNGKLSDDQLSKVSSYNLCKKAIDKFYTDADGYDGTDESKEFYKNNTLVVLDNSEEIYDNLSKTYIKKYPNIDAIIEDEKNNKIYNLPYTIAYDKDNQIASFYLNSISEEVNMSMVEDELNTVVNFAIDHIKIERNSLMGDKSYKITVDVMPNGDYTKVIKDGIINTDILRNVLMLKGFMYDMQNPDIVDGYFDFKFESYSDDIFTFSAEIIIDDSLDNSSSCSIMTNLYSIDNLIIPDDLNTDKDNKYIEERADGSIYTKNFYRATTNDMYLNMNVFNMKLGIGVYYLNYPEKDPKTQNLFTSTISDVENNDYGDRILAEIINGAGYGVASTHSINTMTQYPDFVIKCDYSGDIVPLKYTLANVYDNSGNLINLYTDMSDFIRSTCIIIKDPAVLYNYIEDSNGLYYKDKDGIYRLIRTNEDTDISNGDTLLNGDADTEYKQLKFDLNCDDSDVDETSLNDILICGNGNGLDGVSIDDGEYKEGDKRYRREVIDSSKSNFIILQDVPVVQYSKAMDETISTQLINTIINTRDYLSEINLRITNNFSLDYKFFRTYGPGRYFILSTVDGLDKKVDSSISCCTDDNCSCNTGDSKDNLIAYPGTKSLENLDITIEFTILIRNGLSISDSEVVSQLKNHIKSYIENLNEQESDYTIYMSNIITEMETKYIDFIKSIELVSINGNPDVYRILRYNLPDELRSDEYKVTNTKEIRDYVPEYINVPLDNITINVTRTKY